MFCPGSTWFALLSAQSETTDPDADSMSPQTLLPPPVQWAQRKNLVYLNIALEDAKDTSIK